MQKRGWRRRTTMHASIRAVGCPGARAVIRRVWWRAEIVYGSMIEGVSDPEGDVEDRVEDDMDEAFDDYPADQTGL
jgi:hypothetical protein